MKKIILPFLFIASVALADEPVISIDANGTITCKGHCTGTISGGVLVVCRGDVCLQIIQSPAKNSPN